MRFLALALLFAIPSAYAQHSPWQLEPSETTANLRGIHAVGNGVVWASGTNGTVLRSQDSGFEWQNCAVPPGAEKLDFRAVWAFDDQTAWAMSSGSGAASRLFRTTDGCAHWTLLYTNPEPRGFWDDLVLLDKNNGYILGDPQDGALVLLRTADGGLHWTSIHFPLLPQGSPSGAHGAFAASNSAMVQAGPRLNSDKPGDALLWIATGGPGGSLLYRTTSSCRSQTDAANAGEASTCLDTRTGTPQALPMNGASASAGIFSIEAIWEDERVRAGVAVGGDYTQPNQRAGTAAYSTDGGRTWQPSIDPPGGYRSAVEWQCPECPFLLDDPPGGEWITVGPNGSDISRDNGRTWQPLEHAPDGLPPGGEWNALSLPWAVGPHGRIGKLDLPELNQAPTQAPSPRR